MLKLFCQQSKQKELYKDIPWIYKELVPDLTALSEMFVPALFFLCK
jgi:hypothetical protein